MTRPVSIVRVDLRLTSPWSVGAVADAAAEVNLPVLLDPRGEVPLPYLPATTLVGALRRHLGPAGERWLGPEDAEESGPRASPLRCLGTRLDGSTEIAVRRTTAIDARRRAATGNTLRTAQQVQASEAAPTLVRWWLQHDLEPGSIADLLTALSSWAPFVGRGRNVGQGDAATTAVHYAELDLDIDDHLSWWLGERHSWDGIDAASAPPGWRALERDLGARPVRPEVWTVSFEVVEPLFLGSDISAEPAGGRGRIRVSANCVPATSWKGIFRNRVEHVLRVSGLDPEGDGGGTMARLFGSGRVAGVSVKGGERGVLRFRPSPIATDAPTVTRTHVAIDRVTGGARDRAGQRQGDTQGGALYTLRAYAPGTRLDLTVELLDTLSAAERNLLWQVVRDLDDGIIGVGGMTSRGYGTLGPLGPRREAEPVVVAELAREAAQ